MPEKTVDVLSAPISYVAVPLAVQLLQDPVAARQEMLQRAEKAFYVSPPPPPPPEAPSPFE